MHPLSKIIEEATDDKVSVGSVLRKCLVVAHQLENDRLKRWVQAELNGYESDDDLPPYRVLSVHAVGFFIGSFGRYLQNQPLPAVVMKPEHQHWATIAHLKSPVATYAALIDGKEKENLAIQWPGDLVVFYQTAWFKDSDMALNRAHQVIPYGGVVTIVETVRNKLLEFALDLKREIGEEQPSPQNPPPPVVDSKVVNIILGGTNILGGTVQGDVNSAVHQTVIKGDFKSLSTALTEIGVPEPLHDELREAIEADQKASEPESAGQRVKSWIAKAAKATGKGALKIGGKAVDEIIKHAIDAYVKGQLPLP